MRFSDWITRKYLDWRSDKIGNEGSITQFARLFNVSQPLMSEWLKTNGKVPRSKKYIDALIAEYGEEVYEVLKIPRPKTEPLKHYPPRIRRRLLDIEREIESTLLTRGVNSDSPEGEQITIRIMAEHGFKYTATLNDEN